MLGAMFRYWDEHISRDGAWWILALDGILLIPLIFAAFFYPVAVAIVVAVVLVLGLALMGIRRVVYSHGHSQPHG
jgi:uncharacterized membrane protein HdeD (DUF308 family)